MSFTDESLFSGNNMQLSSHIHTICRPSLYPGCDCGVSTLYFVTYVLNLPPRPLIIILIFFIINSCFGRF